ncbi:MAG: hypothetical protein QOE84_1118 [Actinomycetota bacterium]|jgi:hypothetical protein|nr:hypothetical protein [Actinomycetota bacterium]
MLIAAGDVLTTTDGTGSGLGDCVGSGDGEGVGVGDGASVGDGEGAALDGTGLGEVCSSTEASARTRSAISRNVCAWVEVRSAFWLCDATSCSKSPTAVRTPAASPALAALVMAFILVCRSAFGELDEQPARTTQTAAAARTRLTSPPSS